jgi:hypothetical protein
VLRLVRTAVIAVVAVAGTLLIAAPAQAATIHAAAVPVTPVPVPMVIDVSCVPPSTDTLTFTPPLTLVVQPTTITKVTRYNPCMAPAVPNLTSGVLSTTSFLNDACPMVLLSGTVVQNITWNTGQTSQLTLSRTASITGTTLTVNFLGTVTAGLFLGSNVKQIYTASAIDLINCLNGLGVVKSIVSRVNLTIYH